ncbi:uroporphyrinogen-III synthase [Thalassobaculum sp.]|uniref:uroporphyrinogen-III synthase n=1 Tax=Thalassobaculum sp. TaxID=2022740 RepID=UPI0032EBD8FC
MTCRVLVTRPQAEAEALAIDLTRRGHEAVIAPMLVIRSTGIQLQDAERYQAAAVTSRNGVDGLASATDRRAVPVFAVGEATAEQALAVGFSPVTAARGTGGALVDLIQARLKPENGPILWASGDEVRVDLTTELGKRGFAVERAVVYRAEAVDRLSDAGLRALTDRPADAVLFFSPRTAERFVRLVLDAGLDRRVTTMAAHCLSPPIADTVKTLPWATIRTAARPTRDDLLAMLDDTISSNPD